MSVGLQRLREDADTIRRGALDKGEDVTIVDRAIALDVERRSIQAEVDGLRSALKQQSAAVGAAVKGGAKPDSREVEALRLEARDLGGRIADRDSRLQRSLISWFLDVHTSENGFTEVWPPAVVNAASARGTGQIPDKEDQMYVVTRDDLYLVPTAEVPVTNLHRDEIFGPAVLPVRYAAYSPCFRREAGAAGKDTRGIVRVH